MLHGTYYDSFMDCALYLNLHADLAHFSNISGGHRGFSDLVWKVIKHEKDGKSPSITFTYDSFDGEEGESWFH